VEVAENTFTLRATCHARVSEVKSLVYTPQNTAPIPVESTAAGTAHGQLVKIT